MDPRYEWLDRQIEKLRDDRSIKPLPVDRDIQLDSSDMSVLLMAAHLNALRPGATTPEAGFLSSLRDRVIVAAGSTSRLETDNDERRH